MILFVLSKGLSKNLGKNLTPRRRTVQGDCIFILADLLPLLTHFMPFDVCDSIEIKCKHLFIESLDAISSIRVLWKDDHVTTAQPQLLSY